MKKMMTYLNVVKKKRGIFPKSATSLMRAWLFQHLNVYLNRLLDFEIKLFLFIFVFSIHIHLKNKKKFLLEKQILIYYKLIIGMLIA